MTDHHSSTLPFRVVVEPPSVPPLDPEGAGEAELEEQGEGWSLDEIESAYQQALESLDTLDATVAEAIGEPEHDVADEPPAVDALPVGLVPEPSKSFFSSTPMEAPAPTVTSRQVLEALLFVGGMTLPSRKLADVLSGSTSNEDVLRLIDELNSLYDAECRPYRIELARAGIACSCVASLKKCGTAFTASVRAR